MRSNFYVISFMTGITMILGFLLSISATSLKAKQDLNIEIDIKKNILSSLNIPSDKSQQLTQTDVQDLFDERITTITIDENGVRSETSNLNVYVSTADGVPTGYSIPIEGKGLWSTIYGYMAFEPDGNTVKGVNFYKHGETPGLGGELEKKWFTSNFIGKTIYDSQDNLVSIEIVKGKLNPNDKNAPHKVDGISGATLTGKGMNLFITQDLTKYKPFLDRVRAGEEVIK